MSSTEMPSTGATSDAGLARERMVRAIERIDRETLRPARDRAISRDILYAMTKTPRHLFVPRAVEPMAYLNQPLSAGDGLSEPSPFLVALMTDLADIDRGESVLIAGIGGGYHAALLSGLAGEIRCIDIDPDAVRAARDRFRRFYYENVSVREADPYYGWPEDNGGFDAIIVRQAVSHVPAALLRQLRPGGRLVLPLGGSREAKTLTVIERAPSGRLSRRAVMPVDLPYLPGGSRI
jgi:protein-L-isoaspartate(D-aspartate) O-methyltransferase